MMPELGLFSDVLAGYWLRDNPVPGNLRYIFACHIQNEETLRVVAEMRMKATKSYPTGLVSNLISSETTTRSHGKL